MQKEIRYIQGIPAILWGTPSRKLYLHVHGKMSRKEYAEDFARIAERKGYQTLSFDLPEHGERTDPTYRCDVWNGKHDLNLIAEYAFAGWESVALFACSLGAYFALNTYADRPFAKCLFQSPIVDMKWLVEHMMLWSDVSEKQLKEKKEIVTEIDILRWDYYQYILTHPVRQWQIPTDILYGAKDHLQPIESLQNFAKRFQAKLTVSKNSEHAFMASEDQKIVEQWIEDHI